VTIPVKAKLKAYLELFRPELPFAAGICVILGEFIALGKFPSFWPMFLGFTCGFFLSGTALVLNDTFDLEVDRVNTPERAIPSGRVSLREAVILSILSTLLGLVAALAINLPALVLGILFWVIGFLYNWKFKQTGLPGNLMVSASVAVTFILGGIAVGQPWNKIVWLFSLLAFLIDLGEEIAGDAMDMEGDRKRASKSIAIKMGRRFALRVSGIIFALVILVSFVPYVFGWFGFGYLIMITIMDLAVIYFTVRLLRSSTSEEGRFYMRRIYLLALFGMLAFLLGQLFA
jgi:geranylgeranylglycerol-phosphate geranylgeranyltransferase